jgi:hypothetical protein
MRSQRASLRGHRDAVIGRRMCACRGRPDRADRGRFVRAADRRTPRRAGVRDPPYPASDAMHHRAIPRLIVRRRRRSPLARTHREPPAGVHDPHHPRSRCSGAWEHPSTAGGVCDPGSAIAEVALMRKGRRFKSSSAHQRSAWLSSRCVPKEGPARPLTDRGPARPVARARSGGRRGWHRGHRCRAPHHPEPQRRGVGIDVG